ncbi:CpaF family protein [Actinocatenispora comari]|uniref:Protein kinase n=1 Tax=Actinocatenispora comari TaxID=2807577 RepID=A0A8J4A5Q5_9ACTN|nr:ATPase, T2SS/T4P/T4SS family [Actinocatenispora comari]GIL25526.1 protein kinase [Actinocatenispora comari]
MTTTDDTSTTEQPAPDRRRHDQQADVSPGTGLAERDVGVEQISALRARLTERLTDQAQRAETAGHPLTGAARRQAIEQLIEQLLDEQSTTRLQAGGRPLDGQARSGLAATLRAGLSGLGPFERLLADPDVEDVRCNGADQVWVRYADGRHQQVPPVAASDSELADWVRRSIAGLEGEQERRFDRAHPIVSGQLPDGSRLHAVAYVGRRVYVALRRFRLAQATLDELRRTGTVDATVSAVLAAAVRARLNILISGGTALGKTTLLRALAAQIDPAERIITVEDAYELGLERQQADAVALQVREANIEGVGEIDSADLVRSALRMSPDRVIVGEVRGGEVVPMLLAMSQGCDGSMGTVHASTSQMALGRLATYARMSAQQLQPDAAASLIADAVHLVVHLDYMPGTNTRVVSSIREIAGHDGATVASNEIFRPDRDRRARLAPGAVSDRLADTLITAGLDERILRSCEGW